MGWTRRASTPFWMKPNRGRKSSLVRHRQRDRPLRLRHGRRLLALIEFGAADGLRSRETAINSHPSAWRSRDGHLWFATPKGLVEVDPAHFPVNTIPPPVALERFAVDDVDQPLRGAAFSVPVQAGHVHFQFDYAGLSFSSPQKVRLPLHARGFDHGWTEAGTRRTAYYTTFRRAIYIPCAGGHNDGLWNSEGAALAFELRPHFYQTIWFYALLLALAWRWLSCCCGCACAVQRANSAPCWASAAASRARFTTRWRRLRRHQRAVGGAGRASADEQGRSGSQASGFDSRLCARGPGRRAPVDMGAALTGLGRDHSAGCGCGAWSRQRTGMVWSRVQHLWRLSAASSGHEREILRIAQEAIHNVKKHAGAKHLFVQLEYGPDGMHWKCGTTGAGLQRARSWNRRRALRTDRHERAGRGHWRTLEVTSEPDAGTTVRFARDCAA